MSESRYFVILARNDIDRFQHNQLFGKELMDAFARKGWRGVGLDYLGDSKKVYTALQDPDCKFFLSFNGFGTELKMPTMYPGRLSVAFDVFDKPIVDLMHDCPLHESMSHQLHSTHPSRRLFITDYTYAAMATDLGVRNVRLVPSITFPTAVAELGAQPPRDIPILFAAGFLDPAYVRGRFEAKDLKGRLYKGLFEEVAQACTEDWALDPWAELGRAFDALGLDFRKKDVDHRFLLSALLDYVKLDRRRQILGALRDFDVTVVVDRAVDSKLVGTGFRVMDSCNARDLLQMMRRSAVVVCPTIHMTGFHERAMSAFSAASVVATSPCIPLATSFSDGADIAFFADSATLQERVSWLVGDPVLAEQIGQAGQKTASTLFHPDRLVSAMLNNMNLRDPAYKSSA